MISTGHWLDSVGELGLCSTYHLGSEIAGFDLFEGERKGQKKRGERERERERGRDEGKGREKNHEEEGRNPRRRTSFLSNVQRGRRWFRNVCYAFIYLFLFSDGYVYILFYFIQVFSGIVSKEMRKVYTLWLLCLVFPSSSALGGVETSKDSHDQFNKKSEIKPSQDFLSNVGKDSREQRSHLLQSKAYQQTLLLPHIPESQDKMDGTNNELSINGPANEDLESVQVTPNQAWKQNLHDLNGAKSPKKEINRQARMEMKNTRRTSKEMKKNLRKNLKLPETLGANSEIEYSEFESVNVENAYLDEFGNYEEGLNKENQEIKHNNLLEEAISDDIKVEADENLLAERFTRKSKGAIYNNEYPDISCPSLKELNFCAIEEKCKNSCEKKLHGIEGPLACNRMCYQRCECMKGYISLGSSCIPHETCDFLVESLSIKEKEETIYAVMHLPQDGPKAKKINRFFDKLSNTDNTPEEILKNLEKITSLVNKMEAKNMK